MIKNQFNKNLKDLRNNSNLTQSEIAKKLNITQGTYGNYELGNREPNFDVLLQISKLFNISIDLLLNSDIAFTNRSILEQKVKNLIDFEMDDFSMDNLILELTAAKKKYINLMQKDIPNKIKEIDSILHYLNNYPEDNESYTT